MNSGFPYSASPTSIRLRPLDKTSDGIKLARSGVGAISRDGVEPRQKALEGIRLVGALLECDWKCKKSPEPPFPYDTMGSSSPAPKYSWLGDCLHVTSAFSQVERMRTQSDAAGRAFVTPIWPKAVSKASRTSGARREASRYEEAEPTVSRYGVTNRQSENS